MKRTAYILLLFAAGLCLPAALGIGSGSSGFGDLFDLIAGRETSPAVREIIVNVRLPRALAAFLTGAMLAAAGAAMQTVFRNPLASPHVLGVVNASALGAVTGMFLGAVWMAPFSILFGLGVLLLLFIPAGRGRSFSSALILCGIAVNAFTSALMSGILYLADERLQGFVFWLLGGFWRLDWQSVGLLAPTAAVGLGILLLMRTEMNMLMLGERTARHSGVNTTLIQILAVVMAALLTATAVSCCGVIGFVGLLVPHWCRMAGGADFRKLLPLSIACGGILLVLADTAARSLFPMEVPVGILTSLAGAPFFFYLLIRRNRSF